MAVQTPSYWKEAKYQPLIEETTAYGNKVLIPQSLLRTWKAFERLQKAGPVDIERAKAEGFFKPNYRNRLQTDLKKVYFELYEKE